MANKKDLSEALSQRKNVPPLQRGKGIQLSSDEAKKQEHKEAESLESSTALEQQSETVETQASYDTTEQESEVTEQQLKEIAKMLQKVMAKEQVEEKAKPRKEDPADLLIHALADVQSGVPELEQFRKLAELQRKKVNQGVTIPESLFSIYKSCAMGYTLKGKKVTMGDLMAKALIKYLVEDIIPDLGPV